MSAIELDELSGDVAGLIGYHRAPTGLVHDDEIDWWIRRYDMRYIGSVQLVIEPSGLPFAPHIRNALQALAPADERQRWTRAEILFIASAVTITLLWAIGLLLFAFHTIDTINGGTTP